MSYYERYLTISHLKLIEYLYSKLFLNPPQTPYEHNWGMRAKGKYHFTTLKQDLIIILHSVLDTP